MEAYLSLGGDRHSVSEPGRLVALSSLPRRYDGVARYLSRAFEMSLCGVSGDADLMRALRSERERSIVALEERIGHAPSRAEVLSEVGPECETAWIFQEGVSPKDHRKYLFIFLFLSAVGVVSLALAGRWVWVFRVRPQG